MRFLRENILLYFFLMMMGVGGFFLAMILPRAAGFHAFIAFAALGGFGVAAHIFSVKRNKAELVCPVGSDCNVVICSRYSTFLGIPLEHLGMAYYALLAVVHGSALLFPSAFSASFLSAIFAVTVAALFFSLYLVIVQAFLLRQWCIWCLLSVVFSTAIFIFSLALVDRAAEMLASLTPLLEASRATGFVLGMGGATATMVLFAHFLRDRNINGNEAHTLKETAELIWLGLIGILVSQFALYVADPDLLARSGSFIVQTTALFVAGVSGAALMILFAPFLSDVPFYETQERKSSLFAPLRTPFFVTGAVAISSWYAAFGVGYVNYGAPVLFFAYAVVLLLSVGAAVIVERTVVSSRPNGAR